VRRNWDYQGGWVRAPLAEIVFNNRLTKQARLLWLWLASIHPLSRELSWADCEIAMACCTKARRNCLAQLIEAGFVSVDDDGVVTVHDPYIVYSQKYGDIIPRVKFEFDYIDPDSEVITPVEVEPEPVSDNESKEQKTENKKESEKVKKSDTIIAIIETWNENKPSSYSKIRTLSTKQLEAINKHIKNLGFSQAEISEFILLVCSGLKRSDFWSNKIDQSGRNLSSVFGYGNPQDTKLRNIESLVTLGQDEIVPVAEIPTMDDESRELIRTHQYATFEYEKAKNRNNQVDITKWQKHLDHINQQLESQNISIETSK
jgi:hypothetical protein